MSFKLKANPTFFAKVSIPQAGGEPQVLEVEFRHMTAKQWEEWRTRLQTMSIQDAVAQAVVGWRGVDVEFSPAALEQLMDEYIPAGPALLAAFGKELALGKQGN